MRLHVYKVKAADLPNIGSDNPEVAVARLMAELRAVVARALPRDPPPPVPYPTRSAHPAPTRAAVAFHMKHLEAISAALVALVEITAEGAFKAPRRRTVLPKSPAEVATPKAKAKGTKRPRGPTAAQAALEGEVFEEDGVDWKVLAVVWDADEEEVVVWYYDVEMAADGDLSEDEMDLARTEGLDLGPLECSSVTDVKGWIRAARSGR